jgi:hypothetical protein
LAYFALATFRIQPEDGAAMHAEIASTYDLAKPQKLKMHIIHKQNKCMS